MTLPREIKFFPELHALPESEQAQRLSEAKALAFGPDRKLVRWRGNLLHFGVMFTVSVLFMVLLAPALSLSREAAALVMLVLILPAFFILQQRRYIRLVRLALAELPPQQLTSRR